MNILSTSTVRDYRKWVQDRIVAQPDEDAATLQAALEAYDDADAQQNARLLHALDNLQRTTALGLISGGGELNTPVIDTAGTTYTNGTDLVVGITDDNGGVNGSITIDVVLGIFENLQILNAGNGYVNPVLTLPAEAGDGDAAGAISVSANSITSVDASEKVQTVVDTLNA